MTPCVDCTVYTVCYACQTTAINIPISLTVSEPDNFTVNGAPAGTTLDEALAYVKEAWERTGNYAAIERLPGKKTTLTLHPVQTLITSDNREAMVKVYVATTEGIKQGKKINVIKLAREATYLGLKEAKDLVEGQPAFPLGCMTIGTAVAIEGSIRSSLGTAGPLLYAQKL